MKEYDPCAARSMQTKHVFELTFQQWGYLGTIIVDVGGNCEGFTNLSAAVSQAYDKLPTRKYPEGEWALVVLKDSRGDILECEEIIEEQRGEDWLMNMLVRARIVRLAKKAPRPVDEGAA